MSNDKKQVIIIGAGVVGLSAAIRVQETGKYNVTVVAETFPTDPRTIRYTSHWAGAHHVSQAYGDARQKGCYDIAIDKETFETMWRDSDPDGSGTAPGIFFRHNHTEFKADGVNPTPWLDYMPDVPENDLIPDSTAGYTMTTFTIHTYTYLNWLLARFLSGGGSTKRASLQHISQVLDAEYETMNPAAIIACPGIGARFLGGIEDKDVYPIRGQTALLRAPWVKFGRTLSGADGSYMYLLPLCTGNVLVGGIRVPNDWHPTPRATDRTYILTRMLRLCPELAPPSVRASRAPTVEDLEALIVDEGCGLRPGRNGGIRLEVGAIEREGGRGTIPVVYNYGHAGMGFQSSWGSASVVLKLLEGALREVSE